MVLAAGGDLTPKPVFCAACVRHVTFVLFSCHSDQHQSRAAVSDRGENKGIGMKGGRLKIHLVHLKEAKPREMPVDGALTDTKDYSQVQL